MYEKLASVSRMYPQKIRVCFFLDCPTLVQVNLCQKLFFCRTWGEHVVYKNCSECQKQLLYTLPRFETWIFMYWSCNSMNNLSSYCGLVDAKMRASDKDLPVPLGMDGYLVECKLSIKFWIMKGIWLKNPNVALVKSNFKESPLLDPVWQNSLF